MPEDFGERKDADGASSADVPGRSYFPTNEKGLNKNDQLFLSITLRLGSFRRFQRSNKFMSMEYLIIELRPDGKVLHGSKFNAAEAGAFAASVQVKTNNPVTVQAEYVSSNQIEDDFRIDYLTAEQLYLDSYGGAGNFADLPELTKRIFEVCAEAGNKHLLKYYSIAEETEGFEN